MRVIARTDGGFLVEVSHDEMPHLKGFEGAYGGYEAPSIGEEINTTKFFSHILSVIDSREKIKSHAEELSTLAADLKKLTMAEIFNRE